jgi:hypothetical protein
MTSEFLSFYFHFCFNSNNKKAGISKGPGDVLPTAQDVNEDGFHIFYIIIFFGNQISVKPFSNE